MKDGWWNLVTTVLPCILGFTIAAFTLVLGLGGDVFRKQLHRPNSKTGVPLYLKIAAIFAHQIIVQTLAVVVAILLSSLWLGQAPTSGIWVDINHDAMMTGWAIGFFLFVYSVLLVFAGALNIYRLAKMIQRAALKEAPAKQCSVCMEEVKATAIKCKHCGSSLLPPPASSPATPPALTVGSDGASIATHSSISAPHSDAPNHT